MSQHGRECPIFIQTLNQWDLDKNQVFEIIGDMIVDNQKSHAPLIIYGQGLGKSTLAQFIKSIIPNCQIWESGSINQDTIQYMMQLHPLENCVIITNEETLNLQSITSSENPTPLKINQLKFNFCISPQDQNSRLLEMLKSESQECIFHCSRYYLNHVV